MDKKIFIAIGLSMVILLVGTFGLMFVAVNVFDIDIPIIVQIQEYLVGPSETVEMPVGVEGMEQQYIVENFIDYRARGGEFDLPVRGATGWVARSSPPLQVGQVFTILDHAGNTFRVITPEEVVVDINQDHIFINLPDILPSIIYDVTNAYSSMMRTSGFFVENVTGQQLYSAHSFNERLGREEFIVPILFNTARLVSIAQQIALENGDTLVMIEAYRPRPTQRKIVDNLNATLDLHPGARSAIDDSPWTVGWFISQNISNHQRGAAVDVSLARVNSAFFATAGEYRHLSISSYNTYAMNSHMHDLSPVASITVNPTSLSNVAWRNATLRPDITEGALRLHNIMLDAGFTPLASEWWHFDDSTGSQIARNNGIAGYFFTESVYSVAP
ncbi:MAG: hypothetical protein FWG63_11695 [Defluviitaleaceae bacterium]|nr:hypothetical protein [Defluviitaleaceae bacterium]